MPSEKIGGDRGSGGAHGERKPRLGHLRIQGALSNLGPDVGRGTIAEIFSLAWDGAGTRAGAQDHPSGPQLPVPIFCLCLSVRSKKSAVAPYALIQVFHIRKP